MGHNFLAIDIGASSGRHILAYLEGGKMRLREIHRFQNSMQEKDGQLCWDLQFLYAEIKQGMRKCKEAGRIPISVGIDTWGVDFVLMDRHEKVLGNTVAYRDNRTQGMDIEVRNIIPEEDLYARTGIQKQSYNTIYQLMAVKKQHPEYLDKAESMLQIPDYLHFLLTGVKRSEYTNTTTTQLVSPETKEWDYDLLQRLGFPLRIFGQIAAPGTVLGHLREEVQEEVGYDCTVVLPATHDTASAVLAVPSGKQNAVYISSGTWSLMGIERPEADCSRKSREHNFTNEGGYGYRFRYLKNIMGLWMIQSVRKEMQERYTFAELSDLASKEPIASIVDCNDDRFLAPDSMIQAVQGFCRESKQQVPLTTGQTAAVIYKSLAACYNDTVQEMEELTGQAFDSLHVVGGGANASFLNALTARYTGRKVYAGPTEATAIGNIMVQMISQGEFANLAQARECVRNSFAVQLYEGH